MKTTEMMLDEAIQKLMKKFYLPQSEAVTAMEFARELFEDYRDILKESEPNATRTISDLDTAANLSGEMMDIIELLPTSGGAK